LILASNKQIKFKIKLGAGNLKDQRDEIEPLKDLGPAIKATQRLRLCKKYKFINDLNS